MLKRHIPDLVADLLDLDPPTLLSVIRQALANHPDFDDAGRGGIDSYAFETDSTVSYVTFDEQDF